jgi:hypothetical protein
MIGVSPEVPKVESPDTGGGVCRTFDETKPIFRFDRRGAALAILATTGAIGFVSFSVAEQAKETKSVENCRKV